MKNLLLLIVVGLWVSSCVYSYDVRNSKPICQESLTKKNTEKVSFSMDSVNIEKELEEWIKKEVPDRADVIFDKERKESNLALSIFKKMGVPYNIINNQNNIKNQIILYYESYEKIDCSKINQGKLDFGCSTSTNIKNMISVE